MNFSASAKFKKKIALLSACLCAVAVLTACNDTHPSSEVTTPSTSVTTDISQSTPTVTTSPIPDSSDEPTISTPDSSSEVSSETTTISEPITTTTPITTVTTTTGQTGTLSGNTLDHPYVYEVLEDYVVSRLSLSKRSLYETVIEGINSMQETISLRGSSEPFFAYELTEEFVTLISRGCVEQFYVSPELEVKINKITNEIVSVTPAYTMTAEEVVLARAELEAEIDKITSQIEPSMSEYDVVKLIHDSIILKCTYDLESPNPYSAYGALVEGRAVCEGYAKAFKLICDRLGIDCVLVTGYGNGQDHMWNMVEVSDEWYHIDLTWDDPITTFKDYIRYDYFCVTEAQASIDHTRIDSLPYGISRPIANTTLANYFIHSGYYARTYEEAREILKAQIAQAVAERQPYIRICLATQTVYNDTYDHLFTDAYGETDIYNILREVHAETGIDFVTNSLSKISNEPKQIISLVLQFE